MDEGIMRIEVEGASLGYSVQGGASEGRPIVFVHGLAMRSMAGPYEELLGLLSRQHVVHALDLRGHGASSDSVEGWTFDQLADDVVAFCRALKLDAPVFVGHSFGAVIGLLAEIRHPGAFRALCLLSPGPADHRKDPVDTLDFLIEHGHNRDALRETFRPMFVRPPGAMLDVTVDAVALVDTEVHREQKRQNPHFSIDDRLKDVAPPTLVVCGEEDKVVPQNRQHDMARKLPRSKEVVFSGEGHMMANESAGTAAGEVLSFLDDDH
ncbi:alpha/beta fold hydrolase [uncultured Sphingomonas sp.]|uniref:alpha/beta fold hydrolase n=1 Tax=uncultured Sphingomonas sp. TaxID=158754 RepID=UPI0035CAC207